MNWGRWFSLCLMFGGSHSVAWAANDGGFPGSFLQSGVGPRARGMGGVFGGIADDATAVYWNPAGLSTLTKPEISASHVSLFEDTSQDFFAAASPLRKYGAFGAAYLQETSGGYEKRDNPFDSPAGFSISKSLLQIGWAARPLELALVPGRWRAGTSVKEVQESIDSHSSSDWGADFGLLYQATDRASVGLLYQNAVAPSVSFTRSVSFVRSFDVSPHYRFDLPESLTAHVGARMRFYGGQSDWASGAEVWYRGLIAWRFGLESRGASTGIGLRVFDYLLDYAVILNDIAPIHMVSLGLRFGKTREELEADIHRGISRFSEAEAKRMANDYYRQALNFASERNYVQAISYLENAALWDAGNSEIQKKLAETKEAQSRDMNRQMIERSSQLGRQSFDQGNYLASQGYWRNVLEIDPDNSNAKQQLKAIDRRLSENEKAAIRRAREEESQAAAKVLSARALDLMQDKRFKEAESAAEKAAMMFPADASIRKLLDDVRREARRDIQARMAMGVDLMERRDCGAALKIFVAVVNDDPKNDDARKDMAKCKSMLQPVEANPEQRKQAERLYFQAVDLYMKGDYQGSQKVVQQVFELDPLNEGAAKLKSKLDAVAASEKGFGN